MEELNRKETKEKERKKREKEPKIIECPERKIINTIEHSRGLPRTRIRQDNENLRQKKDLAPGAVDNLESIFFKYLFNIY